jgi:predicted Zn finger-like uncharacterized protein
MKIQCQSCQAKYTIADEKVLGKVVKIRCKKCSSTIVINGNETRPAEDNQDTNVFDYAGQANDSWTVNVADGDQRTMTGQEIVAEYRTGVVNDETYCWKDGMADWLPLREIEQLYGAVKLAPMRAPTHSLPDEDLGAPPMSVPPPSNAAALFSSNDAVSPVESPFAGGGAGYGNGNANGNGYGNGEAAHAAPVAAASAARRGGGRGQGADLFGNVASAGGEEDVMTSAVSGNASHGGGGGGAGGGMEEQKLTGQRNESSVLFSLSALTEGGKSEAAANRTTATSDGSGLIDIRALSQTMGSDDKKDTNARVDDIMNLSGGGAFGAALAAPILAPPPLEMSSHDYNQGGQGNKSNKMLFVAIIAGAALIAIGIVVAVVLTRPSVPPIDASNANGTASGMNTAAGSPSGTGAMAMNDPSAPASAVTAPTTPPPDNTPPPPGTGNANAKTPAVTGGGAKTTPPAGGGGATAAKTPDPVTPPTPKPADPPKDFGSALAAAAGQPKTAAAPDPNAGGGSTAPFDRGAASGAIGAVNVQSCAKPGGPTGGGHVKITFAPNGSVSSAAIDSGPFPGTPVGGCIVGKFRGPHVPAFSGGAITVGKSFTIN